MKKNELEELSNLDSEKAKLISRFKSLWELKGSKPTSREGEKAGISDRQVRKHFGGWATLQDLSVPDKYMFKPEGKLIADTYKSIAKSANKKQIMQQFQMEEFYAQLSESMKKMTVKPLQLNKKEIQKHIKQISAPTQIDRELICVWSDTHFGLNVDSEEVGHKNDFGWTQACRRAAHFAKEIASYKLHHRHKCKKLHVMALGDLIQGVIHNKAGLDNDLLIFQKAGMFHIFYHTLAYLKNYFDEIEVHCIPGNHDDNVVRREGGRISAQKYDSNINDMFYALSAAFKGEIKFNMPKTQYVLVDSIGGRILGAHGDTTFSALGNPGSSINMKSLTHQVESFSQGEVNHGNPPIKAVILGHVHQKLHARTQNGIDIIVNPSLSGLDTFASSLTINNSNQGQTIVESTKEYAIGDTRVVYFDKKVDTDKSLDKIIPIYGKELVFKG